MEPDVIPKATLAFCVLLRSAERANRQVLYIVPPPLLRDGRCVKENGLSFPFEDVPSSYNADYAKSTEPPSLFLRVSLTLTVSLILIADLRYWVHFLGLSSSGSPVWKRNVFEPTKKTSIIVRFYVFTRCVFTYIVIVFIVTQCSLLAVYQCFGGSYCHHLQGWTSALRMEAVFYSETLVFTFKSTQLYNPEDQHPHVEDKYLYPRNMK